MNLTGKILIVDDEPINLEFFDVMLSKLGFQVEKACDGEEALKKVVDSHPDLMILDNIMPKLSGWEVAKRLKQDREYRHFRNVPIIMFSAMDAVEDKIEGFELGVEDYITKPFNFSEVLARIRAVLRNRELTRQVAHRERRIAVVESLNKSLLFFTQHIRKPISELIHAAEGVDTSVRQQAAGLIEKIQQEGSEILASLEGLEEEVRELQDKDAKLKEGSISLEELEQKLQKHLERWKQRDKVDEAVP